MVSVFMFCQAVGDWGARRASAALFVHELSPAAAGAGEHVGGNLAGAKLFCQGSIPDEPRRATVDQSVL